MKNILFIVIFYLWIISSSLISAQEGYYLLGEESLEVRRVSDINRQITENEDWEEIFDIKGSQFIISKESIIGTDDMEGILIKKMRFKEKKEEYHITIYFKKESWDKIYDTTKSLIGRKVGIVKRDKILSIITVTAPFSHAGEIKKFNDLVAINFLIDGFIPKEKPREDEREQEYIQWLEQRAQKLLPEDSDIVSKLISEYMYGKTRDYAKAVVWLKELIEMDSSNQGYLFELGTCYTHMEKYEEAIIS